MFLKFLLWPLTLPPVVPLLLYATGAALMLLVVGRNFGLDALSILFIPWCYLLYGLLALTGQQKLRDVARGNFADPIAAGATDLNAFQSGLALKLALLFLVVLLLELLLVQQALLLLLVAVVYPALYIALVLEESLREGFRVSLLLRIVRGTQLLYLLAIVLISGSAFWLARVLIYDQSFLLLLASAYAFLLAHPLAGWLLYLRRGTLDLHTDDSPEQRRAVAALAQSRELEQQLDVLNRQCATGAIRQANVKLEAFLGESTAELDPVVHARLLDLSYTELFLEHGVYYLQRLLERDEPRKAWIVFKDCRARDERFRPLTAQGLLDIVRAAEREDSLLVESLLADFSRAYPDSELVPEALFRQARVNIELLRDGSRGISLLKKLEAEHPQFAGTADYRRYRARLRISRDG